MFFGRPKPCIALDCGSDLRLDSFMALDQCSRTAKRYGPTVPDVEQTKEGPFKNLC